MQIFLPVPDFAETAKILDKKRLFKQLVECRQVLATMGECIVKNDGSPMKSSHIHHPIHRMWKGFAMCLRSYHNSILTECLFRGIKTTIEYLDCPYSCDYPRWFGYTEFHASHRSNLLRKNFEYYSQFGWDEPDNLEYIWY